SPSSSKSLIVPCADIGGATPTASARHDYIAFIIVSRGLTRTRTSLMPMPATWASCIAGSLWYHQDALHHQDSGDQLKAVQVECLGLQEAHQNHRGAAAECSETPDAYRGVQADHPEFQDDHQDHSDAPAERSGLQVAHQDAPAEHSEFQDDRQACQDAPAEHSEFQDDRQDCQDAPAYRWGVQADY